MVEISRQRYRQLYGPTTGDRVRLADTDLLIEVEAALRDGKRVFVEAAALPVPA